MEGKLVRDKIPEIIKADAKMPITHVADDTEYWEKLKNKMNEEISEFLETESKEELADVLEVIYAVCDFMHFDKNELEEIRKKKAEEKGGFEKKIILDSVQ